MIEIEMSRVGFAAGAKAERRVSGEPRTGKLLIGSLPILILRVAAGEARMWIAVV